jgi:hypothetical protein
VISVLFWSLIWNLIWAAYVNVAGCLAAQCDFGAFDPVDGGIAGWSAAQHIDRGLWQEAKVHQVVEDIMGQLERGHHCRFAHLDLTQRHHLHLDHMIMGYPTPDLVFKGDRSGRISDYNRMREKRQVRDE